MTRITTILCQKPSMTFNGYRKNGRLPQQLQYLKNRPIRDISLKNSVISRGATQSDIVCIQEMMNLFGCLEANEFNEKECVAETDAMQSCYSNYLKRKKAKENLNLSEPTPGDNKFTKEQLNTLLKRYPQPLKNEK